MSDRHPTPQFLKPGAAARAQAAQGAQAETESVQAAQAAQAKAQAAQGQAAQLVAANAAQFAAAATTPQQPGPGDTPITPRPPEPGSAPATPAMAYFGPAAQAPAQPQAPSFVRADGTVIPPGGRAGKTKDDLPPVPRRFAVIAFVLALFAGLVLAEQPTGVGLGLLGAVLALTCLTLLRERDRFATACLVCAAMLGAVPAFRDSGWVTTLSIGGALTLASIGVTRAATWREAGVGVVAWIGQLLPAPFLIFAEATRRAAGRRWGASGPVLRGVALASGLVLVFGTLFASADEQFAELVRDLFDWNLDLGSVIGRVLIFGLVLTVAGSLFLTSVTRKSRPAVDATTKLGRTEWLIALGSVVVVFAGFVLLQLPEFFGGDALIQTTRDFTYADNARRGFGQLILAAGLTLSVVASSVHFGPSGDRAVRILDGILCLLTIVVLASALHRLGLYQDAYGATRTRFSMHTLMLWLGAVLLLVVVAGGLDRTSILPRAIVLLSAVFALGTVVANPDGRIAERNIERYSVTGTLDTDYLTSMSGDAAYAVRKLPPALRNCTAAVFLYDLGTSDPVQSLNLGRIRARNTVEAIDPPMSNARVGCSLEGTATP